MSEVCPECQGAASGACEVCGGAGEIGSVPEGDDRRLKDYHRGLTAGRDEAFACPIHVMPHCLPAVYLLTWQGAVAYVGQSVNVLGRVSVHHGHVPAEYVIIVPCDRRDLDALEAALIDRFKPTYNQTAGNGANRANCEWVVRLVKQRTGIEPPKLRVSRDETRDLRISDLEIMRQKTKAKMEQRLERMKKCGAGRSGRI